MAIELFTGKPGAGKTHHAVQRAIQAIQHGRPVYVCNMNGMDIPGAMTYEDPRKWMELPAGALLIVDEAQRFWRATRASEPPPELQEAETHRHLGIDMLLTTQQPTYLLKHLRGLIMPHTHHERLTKSTTRTFTWHNRCVEEPESQSERALSEEGVHVLTRAEFGRYKSTEQDTHKPKIPKKLLFVIAAVVAVVVMLWWVNQRVQRMGVGVGVAQTATASAQPSRSLVPAQGRAHLTPAAYFAQFVPRNVRMPWSASVFDEREAVSQPEIYCMTSSAGFDAAGDYMPERYTCITEQGQRVTMSISDARDIARTGGAYNPYRDPQQQQQQQQQPAQDGARSSAPLSASASLPARATSSGDDAQQAGYGSMRNRVWPAYTFKVAGG